jgi:hypothetical protein
MKNWQTSIPIVVASIFAAGMGMLFAIAGAKSTPGSGVIPAALAFLAVSLLGTAVMLVIGSQERRIQELERRLELATDWPAHAERT